MIDRRPKRPSRQLRWHDLVPTERPQLYSSTSQHSENFTLPRRFVLVNWRRAIRLCSLVTMEFPSVAHLYTFFFSPPFMSLEVILFWQPKLMKAFRNFKDHVSGLVSTLPLVKE